MSSTSPVATGPAATDPSVVDLRRLIHDYTPASPAGNALQGTMLGLTDLLEELTWRGMLAQSTDEAALRGHLSDELRASRNSFILRPKTSETFYDLP